MIIDTTYGDSYTNRFTSRTYYDEYYIQAKSMKHAKFLFYKQLKVREICSGLFNLKLVVGIFNDTWI